VEQGKIDWSYTRTRDRCWVYRMDVCDVVGTERGNEAKSIVGTREEGRICFGVNPGLVEAAHSGVDGVVVRK
jgi:hypothetical protein